MAVSLPRLVSATRGCVIRNSPQTSPPPPAATALATDASIAVLPFVNMSSDPEQEYFSDGLSEEVLNLLVKLPDLKVIARTSSFAYKGKDTKIADIARKLPVAYVLEGSVRKSSDIFRWHGSSHMTGTGQR